ncbi:uncharacterized protein N7498_001937 [Penicillium cinerascens]|uniref:Uncharacterized protein n=1 Tax=Penicillium cinerascens TaxID=70096 RepID=A0A9W9N923_9EURO|nr:uncharacterized protein N7498_001937 [Penicillium cinerascens]KAJ5215530.1 hypothetical protein N7498_001937 [Penicillium cinerascens]
MKPLDLGEVVLRQMGVGCELESADLSLKGWESRHTVHHRDDNITMGFTQGRAMKIDNMTCRESNIGALAGYLTWDPSWMKC